MEANLEVHFYDYNRMKKILKDFDPELRKAMDREIRGFLKPLAKDAKGILPPMSPMSNWARKPVSSDADWAKRRWDETAIKAGISVRQGGARSKGSATTSMWRLINRSPAGSIYELAGNRRASETPQGQAFIARIEKVGGETVRTSRGKPGGRLIWKAYEKAGGDAAITRQVYEIARRYEQMLVRAVNERGRLK